MNILIITGSLSGGGTERVSVILANFLSEKGFNVHVAILHLNKATYRINKNIKIHKLPSHQGNLNNFIFKKLSYFIRNCLSLKNIIANNKIKTIISFCILPEILILLLTKRMDILLSKRNYPPASSSIKFFLEKQIFKFSKTVVFQTFEQMTFYDNKTRKKGIIIPNPILENLPVPYIGKRKKKIITFCRLAKQKNLYMLIDGFMKFHEMFPDYKLVIYGNRTRKENSYKDELEDYIGLKNMKSIIEIEDFSHNIHNLVIDTTCFVLTSDFEGISNSMLEAMAMGLPVISTDCKGGGARAFIKNYENGILVPINDRDALSQALMYIANNPDEAQKLGRKASEIRDMLSREKICRKWLEIL